MSRARELADLSNVINKGANLQPNLIINGDMSVSQRGTSTTSTNVYLIDRFSNPTAGFTQYASTYSQDTDAPSGFSNSLKLTTTTAETTIDAGDIAYIATRLEGLNLQTLDYGTSSAKTITLSFWVKSSVTGTYGVGLYQDDGPYNYTTTYTIDTANTWERKTLKITGNTSNTIANDNTEGLRISFILAAGSTYNDGSASDAWESYANDKYASGHLQNGVVTTLNSTWQLTGVSLVVGDSAPVTHPYESYAENFQRCQRYFQNNDGARVIVSGNTTSGQNYYHTQTYPVQLRAAATCTFAHVAASGFTAAAPNLNNSLVPSHEVYRTSNANANGGYYLYTYTADAEL